jgi:hypothetical protein
MELLHETGHTNKASTLYKHGITSFGNNLLADSAIYVETVEKPSKRANNRSNFKQLMDLSKGKSVVRTDTKTGAKTNIDLYALALEIPRLNASMCVLKEESKAVVISSVPFHSERLEALKASLVVASDIGDLETSITIRVEDKHLERLEILRNRITNPEQKPPGNREVITREIAFAKTKRVVKKKTDVIGSKLKEIYDYLNDSLINIHEQIKTGQEPTKSLAILLHKLKSMFESEIQNHNNNKG